MEIITEDDGVNLYFHDCDGLLREIFKLENKHFVRIKSDTNITIGSVYSPVETLFFANRQTWDGHKTTMSEMVVFATMTGKHGQFMRFDFLKPMISPIPLSDFESADNLDSGYHWDII